MGDTSSKDGRSVSRQIWCPHCEKVTDHRLSLLSPVRQTAGEEALLEPADPPLGTRHIVTCLSCHILHSWWARTSLR